MIAIYNLEPKYKNLALEKIKRYYLDNGEEVEEYFPINYGQYDKVYCSSIFTFTPKSYVTSDMICGGSGFGLETKLPPEIDKVKPKLNFGFTTRGCIRNCSFCIVPQKEGRIRTEGDIYDIWDGISTSITLLDNNILALKEHFKVIANQVMKERLKVDFNQGLDIRLLDNEIIKILSQLKYSKQLRFSWDNMKDEKIIISNLKLISKYINVRKIMVYVLVGFNTTFAEDMYRLNQIKALNCDAFVMLYNKCNDKLLKELSHWNNQFNLKNMSFETYLKSRNNFHLLEAIF